MNSFDEYFSRFPDDLQNRIKTCIQDSIHHPEGSVACHLKLVFDKVVELYDADSLLLAVALFHDLGKPETRAESLRPDGTTKVSHIGHENYAARYIELYGHLFADLTTDLVSLKEICANHMRAHLYKSGRLSRPAKREAFEKLATFEKLMMFQICDSQGRDLTSISHDNKANDIVQPER